MLTIINHHGIEGISAREIHKQLEHRSGFDAWFRHYKDVLKEQDEYMLLHPFVKGMGGPHKHKVGDSLLCLPAAFKVTERSSSQLRDQVQEQLVALSSPEIDQQAPPPHWHPRTQSCYEPRHAQFPCGPPRGPGAAIPGAQTAGK